MTYRISTFADEEKTTIRVEGRLTARGVLDLQREFKLVKAPVRLDLSGLISADAEGLRELRSLSGKGAELYGASAYIRQLLDATTS